MKGIARDAGNSEIAFMIKKTLEITQWDLFVLKNIGPIETPELLGKLYEDKTLTCIQTIKDK
jgi:hypothetical protein